MPDELVRAAILDAERDADRVGDFLTAIGLTASPDRPVPLPAAFLLDLGAALRLLAWEVVGLRIHLDAGLPPARTALRELFLSAAGHLDGTPAVPVGTLAERVFEVWVEKFAWTGREQVGADIALGAADEEAVLECLADFLWQHRQG